MNIIEALTETKLQTEVFYDLTPSDLSKSYGAHKWTIQEILVHLADAESVLHERIKRIICEPKQVIWAFRQDDWSK